MKTPKLDSFWVKKRDAMKQAMKLTLTRREDPNNWTNCTGFVVRRKLTFHGKRFTYYLVFTTETAGSFRLAC